MAVAVIVMQVLMHRRTEFTEVNQLGRHLSAAPRKTAKPGAKFLEENGPLFAVSTDMHLN